MVTAVLLLLSSSSSSSWSSCTVDYSTMASLLKLAFVAGAGLISANPLPALLQTQSGNGNVDLSNCPGYKASNVQTSSTGLTADLTLAGAPCNAYGRDLEDLVLIVEYQTDQRVHVKVHYIRLSPMDAC